MATCSVKGCERVAKSKGWCHAHYIRWWYDGKEPTSAVRLYGTETFEPHFWPKVDKNGPNGCWLWMGSRNQKGYGRGRFNGSYVAAHRFSYELHIGTIPPGLTIDHLCRNPSCVNPAHLEAVSNLENRRRAAILVTHCKKGHEFTPENTAYHSTTGARVCRICQRDYQREWARRKRLR